MRGVKNINHTGEHGKGRRVLNAVFTRETEPIVKYCKAQKRIITQGGTVYEVVRPEKRYLIGCRADQVIFDYAFMSTLKDMVDLILYNSCVPEKFQVIDDRNVIN